MPRFVSWGEEIVNRMRLCAAAFACAAVALLCAPSDGRADFTSGELDQITEHIYRGGAYSSWHACGTNCQTFWSAEQASEVGLLHRQLLTMRTRTKVLPSFKSIGSIDLEDDAATKALWATGSAPKLVSFQLPGDTGQTQSCFEDCPQRVLGIAKDGILGHDKFDEEVLAPANGFRWQWLQLSGTWANMMLSPADQNAPLPCREHPAVPLGFSPISTEQNAWCDMRDQTFGFLDEEQVPIPEPVEDFSNQPYDAVANGATDPDPPDLKADIAARFASGDFEYLEDWYRFRISGGCDPDGPYCSEDLAEKFRPLLYFDNAEEWRPLDVDQFLSESFVHPIVPGGDRHRLCVDGGFPEPPDCSDITSAATLEDAPPDSYIDVFDGYLGEYPMPGCEAGLEGDGLADCVDERTALYYRVHPGGLYLYLDYWWFYRRDSGYAGQQSHEGDWEGVVVAVAPESNPLTFEWAGFESHGTTWRYLRPALRCDGLGDGSCGDAADPIGERVHTYVSSGKHASYPRDCDSDGVFSICRQTESVLPEGGFDGGAPWTSNFRGSALKALPAEDASWLAYQGPWGATTEVVPEVQTNSPRGPAAVDAHQRWDDPSAVSASCRWAESECESALLAAPTEEDSEADACIPWMGSLVAVGICETTQLTAALNRADVLTSPTYNIRGQVGNRSVGEGRGIAQVVGAPLQLGEEVEVQSNSTQADKVIVRFGQADRMMTARFDRVVFGQDRSASIRIRRGVPGRPMPVLRVHGTTLEPDSIWPTRH